MTIETARKRGLMGVRAEAPDAPPVELKGKLDEMHRSIEAFKASHTEQLEALKKGKADAILDEKVEKINASVSELTETLNAQAKKMARASIAQGSSDIQAQKREAARLFAVASGKIKPGDDVTDEHVQAADAYRQLFAKNMRRGDWSADYGIKAEMSVGSEADGGFLAPGEMLSTVATRLFETSDVRQYANVISTSRNYVELPNDTNEAVSGGWVGEKASRSETNTPQVGIQKIDTHEQYAEPHITQTLLDDAAVNVEGWLANKIADILARTENTAFVSGTGVNRPRGFMNYSSAAVTTADASRAWGVLQYVFTGDAAGFAALSTSTNPGLNVDPLIDIISELKPAYRTNARWFMARRTEAELRKVKDDEGRYLADFTRFADGAFGFSLLGFPIATMEDMPAWGAGNFAAAFGDMRTAYTIVDRAGIRVLRDPYTSKPFVKFYTTKRVGGDVVNFDALKLLKVAAS